MKNISSELKLYTQEKDALLARVVLNGYHIEAGIAADLERVSLGYLKFLESRLSKEAI